MISYSQMIRDLFDGELSIDVMTFLSQKVKIKYFQFIVDLQSNYFFPISSFHVPKTVCSHDILGILGDDNI